MAPIDFNHAMVYTTRLDEALAFYRDGLGFQVVDEYPNAYARLRAPGGSGSIALHVVDKDMKMDAATEGLRLYFECAELDAFCAALAQRGIAIDQLPKDMPWGWRHAYLRDPDGHQISLYWSHGKRFERTVMK
jgi:catechol 2,3-dioxygenase-like lactoylglutathione lyase family enzyme